MEGLSEGRLHLGFGEGYNLAFPTVSLFSLAVFKSVFDPQCSLYPAAGWVKRQNPSSDGTVDSFKQAPFLLIKAKQERVWDHQSTEGTAQECSVTNNCTA